MNVQVEMIPMGIVQQLEAIPSRLVIGHNWKTSLLFFHT
jgi:hypothetical protein